MDSLAIVAPDVHYAMLSSKKTFDEFFAHDNYYGYEGSYSGYMAGGYSTMDGGYG
jgi:hypothetical protein